MVSVQQQKINTRLRLNGRQTDTAALATAGLALTACGSGSSVGDIKDIGFPSDYKPPASSYDEPVTADPYNQILNVPYVEPYWVQALEMGSSEYHIPPILFSHEHIFEYAFPEVQPNYDHFFITGWQPATHEMIVASREIFSKLTTILDVSFIEGTNPIASNVISIGRSNQTTTSGISYFPNKNFEIGMDVFISKGYSSPRFISDVLTNYDYEVLVHEIGHALGLKHPFEASDTNPNVLTNYEDNTKNTVMSYDDSPLTYYGNMRPLDWMALTKLYGVKKTYNANDDVYNFSDTVGTFIIDGAGIDLIYAANTTDNVTIDLRPGAHSHLGNKSNYITDGNQLTISYGSDIENVKTGGGNDTIIATSVDNVISTGAGDDNIFAGEGADTINSGEGTDTIDLSEGLQSRDTIVLSPSEPDEISTDTIYGFVQGVMGDVLDVSAILRPSAELFPLVSVDNVPDANYSDGILRLVGNEFTSASDVLKAFDTEGSIEQLSLSDGAQAIIISSVSQSTGTDQNIFHAEDLAGEVEITLLAVLKGNYLDIDQWHPDNFSFVA